MIGRVAAALLLATAPIAWAADPPEVYHVDDDPSQFGRPKRIVVPEYPAAALANHVTGFVDIRGHVSPLRAFTGVEYIPGTQEAAIFVEPLKAVIEYWDFYPLYRNGCFPSDDPVSVRVNFEIDGGKPRIFVTMARAETPKESSMSVVSRENPQYPRTGMRAGLQAYVYARMEVAADGSVSAVETEVYPRRGGLSDLVFEREVKEALSKWRFNSLPDGTTRERAACEDVIFKLRN